MKVWSSHLVDCISLEDKCGVNGEAAEIAESQGERGNIGCVVFYCTVTPGSGPLVSRMYCSE